MFTHTYFQRKFCTKFRARIDFFARISTRKISMDKVTTTQNLLLTKGWRYKQNCQDKKIDEFLTERIDTIWKFGAKKVYYNKTTKK